MSAEWKVRGKALWLSVVAGLCAMGLTVGLAAQGAAKKPVYVAAGVTTAGQITYPINSAANGLVTLLVNVGTDGSAQGMQVLRDVPSLTSVAQQAVQGWKFSGAQWDGGAVAGSVPVQVVFNPFNPNGVSNFSLQVTSGQPVNGNPDFLPAQVTSGVFATYPANSVASGAVVLNLRIGKDGMVKSVSGLVPVPGLTAAATNAVQRWKFAPATYQGKPVASNMVVAFVFVSPEVGSR